MTTPRLGQVLARQRLDTIALAGGSCFKGFNWSLMFALMVVSGLERVVTYADLSSS